MDGAIAFGDQSPQQALRAIRGICCKGEEKTSR